MYEELKQFLELTVLDIHVGRLAVFFVIILLFQILKRLFVKIVLGFMQRLTSKTKTSVDDTILEILDRPLRFMFSLLGFAIALKVLQLSPAVETPAFLIVKSLFIVSLFWILYRGEGRANELLIRKFSNNADMTISFLPLFSKTTRFAIIVIGATIIIQLWGYNIGAIITGLGIGGLAVALAAKDALANFFGSLMILTDRPFRVGDWVVFADVEGTVEDIGFRTTRVRTFAKALVSVPNASIATGSVLNWSMRDRRRIKYSIGVTYSTTREQMQRAVDSIKNMLIDHELIHEEGLMVYFDTFAESSMNIFVYCFTKTTVWDEYLAIRQDVNLRIMGIFEDLKIDFAFPSMSVYMENED